MTEYTVTKLKEEIANLEFAAESFREAASALKGQRDEARRAVQALRFWVRLTIAALVLNLAVLLILAAVSYRDEASERGRLSHAEARLMSESAFLDSASSVALSVGDSLLFIAPSRASDLDLNLAQKAGKQIFHLA